MSSSSKSSISIAANLSSLQPHRLDRFFGSLEVAIAELTQQHELSVQMILAVGRGQGDLEAAAMQKFEESLSCVRMRKPLRTELHLATRKNESIVANRLLKDSFVESENDACFLIHHDTLMHRNALLRMYALHLQNSESLIAGNLIGADAIRKSKSVSAARMAENQKPIASWVSGRFLLIPLKMYQQNGGFDCTLPFELSSIDYSWKALTSGFSVQVCSDAHFSVSVTSMELCESGISNIEQGAGALLLKWRNERARPLTIRFNIESDSLMDSVREYEAAICCGDIS